MITFLKVHEKLVGIQYRITSSEVKTIWMPLFAMQSFG